MEANTEGAFAMIPPPELPELDTKKPGLWEPGLFFEFLQLDAVGFYTNRAFLRISATLPEFTLIVAT
jgi:hypothetical protein